MRAVAACALLALVTACGGGGSSGGSTTDGSTTGDTDSGTGSVGVTVGDAPTDEFDRVQLTLSRIELIGSDDEEDEGSVVVSEETITVDLLALDATTEFLGESSDVPAGQYTQIRLQVDDITLEKLDDAGNVASSEQAQIPGGGELKLNPQGPFQVDDGGAVIVELDVDAQRSFQTIATGNGQLLFRPVVFVNVIDAGTESGDQRLTFLTGTVTRLAEPQGEDAFDLCDVRPLNGQREGDQSLEECERVNLVDATIVFDADAAPIDFAAVDDQSPAVVGGRFVAGEEEDAFSFEALVIDVGDAESFTQVEGTIQADAADGSFTLVTDADEGETGREVTITVADGAVLFNSDGEILDATSLVADAEVRGMGLAGSETDPFTTLTATAISVTPPGEADDDAAEAQGTVTAFDGEEATLTLPDGSEACFVVDSETDFTLVTETAEGSESEAGTVDDITVDAEIDVSGETTDGDCILARSVVIEADSTSET